jgi:hypothetical protein
LEYNVRVWDNFHDYDDDESYHFGTDGTYEEAVEAAQSIVLRSLRHEYKPGMTPEVLYDRYTDFGEDASVHPDGPGSHFSAWEYAKSICKEVCEEQKAHPKKSSDEISGVPRPSLLPKQAIDPDNPIPDVDKLIWEIWFALKTIKESPTKERSAIDSTLVSSSAIQIGGRKSNGRGKCRTAGRQAYIGTDGFPMPPDGLLWGNIGGIAHLLCMCHFTGICQRGAYSQVWAKDWPRESAVICVFRLDANPAPDLLHQDRHAECVDRLELPRFRGRTLLTEDKEYDSAMMNDPALICLAAEMSA